MTGQSFTFCGENLIAEASGALFWPAEETLVVSDLHLGKGRVLAAKGRGFLPPYDASDTLSRLRGAIESSGARRVISLGDSFDHAEIGMAPVDLRGLEDLMLGREWIWVLGNHDAALPHLLHGRQTIELKLGALTFRHEAMTVPEAGEVSGHFHPKVVVRLRGRRIRGKCFVHDSYRLVMPAFGTYTGGLDLTDPALSGLFAPDPSVLLCHKDSVYPLSPNLIAS